MQTGSQKTCLPCRSSQKISQVYPLNPGPAELGYTLSMQAVYPDQLASEEANSSGLTLFAIK